MVPTWYIFSNIWFFIWFRLFSPANRILFLYLIPTRYIFFERLIFSLISCLFCHQNTVQLWLEWWTEKRAVDQNVPYVIPTWYIFSNIWFFHLISSLFYNTANRILFLFNITTYYIFSNIWFFLLFRVFFAAKRIFACWRKIYFILKSLNLI